MYIISPMIESYKDNNSITNPDKTTDEIHEEVSLRPQSFKDFVGQDEIISNLKVYIQAAKKRSESLDHVLYHPSTLPIVFHHWQK